MKESTVIVIAGAIYIATLMMLVRPNSKGPEIINSIFNTFTDLVKGTTGYTP